MKRTLRVAVYGTAGAYAVLTLVDSDRRKHLRGTVDGFQRFGRTLYAGLLASYDYKFVLGAGERTHGRGSDEYKALKKVVDKRNAERMLAVCKKSGAFYNKFGQYVSTLNYALPPEWTETLSELQDRALWKPWDEISTVLLEDFKVPVEHLFSSIETTPIAAASLAQVHRAVTFDGQTVAVKIQYPDLRRLAMNDLAAMNVFFHLVELAFPDFGYTWLFPEFRQVLSSEVDFLQEARNGERVAAQFADDPRVHIPSVRRDLTTDRVLTMEFIQGAKGNDKAWMVTHGVKPHDVANAVTKFFAEQVHEKGMVHCDPHPGNLMVRLHPVSGAWQLVVLDHGMYRRLTPGFRSGYCRLWRALLLQDDGEGREACISLGLRPDEYDAMSLILTMRRANSTNRLGNRLSNAEAGEVYAKYGDVTAGDINRFMQRLPRDLLFVSRNANLVRSLNMDLGGSTRDRLRAHGRAAVKGMVLSDALAAYGIVIGGEVGGEGRAAGRTGGALQPSAGAVEAGSASHDTGGGRHVPGNIVTETSTTILDSVLALLGRRPPPREPMTYLNALSSGNVMDNPTEWELLAAVSNGRVNAAEASRGLLHASDEGSAVLGRGVAVRARPKLGFTASAKLWLSWAHLESTLLVLDTLFMVGSWWTGVRPDVYVSPHSPEAAEQGRPNALVDDDVDSEGRSKTTRLPVGPKGVVMKDIG